MSELQDFIMLVCLVMLLLVIEIVDEQCVIDCFCYVIV